MSSGPYAVVEFEGDSTCVVPIKWLFRENGQLYSYWCDSKRRIEKLEIANPNWPIWAIIRVVARAGLWLE
jgi:hypothetical protein